MKIGGFSVSCKNVLAAFLLLSGGLMASGPALAVVAPDKGAEEADIKDDPAKFFLFHKAGVAVDQARGDLMYCIAQAQPILSMRDRFGSTGGLLGAAINGRMAEIDRFRMRNAAMRKCMGLIGYDRYAMPQVEWKTLVNDGDIVLDNDGLVSAEVVERMAAYASGPVPATEKLPR